MNGGGYELAACGGAADFFILLVLFLFWFLGELLGMEYLYSQTGKTLTPVLQNSEEEDRLVEEVNDEDAHDEGFEEQAMEDITVPVLYEDDPCRGLETSTQASQPQAPASPVDTNMSDEAQVRHFNGYFNPISMTFNLTYIAINQCIY